MTTRDMNWSVELFDKIDWYWMRYHLSCTSRTKLDGSLDKDYAKSREQVMINYKNFIFAEAKRLEKEENKS